MEPPTGTWVASDLSTECLLHYSGRRLEQLGVAVHQQNVFELHKTHWVNSRNLVIMSCICPPEHMKNHLAHLLKRYCGWTPAAADRRYYYDALVFEAVIAQLPASTVVSITRRMDYKVSGNTPYVTYPMAPVLGYTPKACNHGLDAGLHNLQGGDSLDMRFNLDGCLVPPSCSSSIDLVDLCSAAEENGVNVLFLGEWDGSLSAACKQACMTKTRRPFVSDWRPAIVGPRVSHLRELGGSRGDFSCFYKYAEEFRYEELLRQWADAVRRHPDIEQGPLGVDIALELEPRTGLNAAVMWFFAKLVD